MTNPVNGGRFGDLRTIYQGCRALPFALAGLSCCSKKCRLVLLAVASDDEIAMVHLVGSALNKANIVS